MVFISAWTVQKIIHKFSNIKSFSGVKRDMNDVRSDLEKLYGYLKDEKMNSAKLVYRHLKEKHD